MKHVVIGLVISGFLGLGSAALAQSVEEAQRDRAAVMAEEISSLMTDLEARAEGFPAVLQALAEGRSNIEQADETVLDLIAQLTRVTDEMQDGSNFDVAIDDFKGVTQGLIAEADSSQNQVIRDTADSLRNTLDKLEADDAERAGTVVDARNLIRTLEENREAISFLVRAGEVQRAADLISANVGEFSSIVERGKSIADGLLQDAGTF